jgi:hypothetical protein
MSSERKALKVMALILLLMGIVTCVVSIMGMSASGEGTMADAVVSGAVAVFGFVCGALGVRGANVPAKAHTCVGGDIGCAVVGAAATIWMAFVEGSGGLLPWLALIIAVLAGISVPYAIRVRDKSLNK